MFRIYVADSLFINSVANIYAIPLQDYVGEWLLTAVATTIVAKGAVSV